ncbi:hypothetical protein PIB30_033379 [Stylosanthes scabra]|uniref:Uncharacterized protein n=1 Tax=Stylosanthes scabra TaxID=79078 RepID=A0ABU6ZB14_9FABA|nr:hypothetical protein [Stylosanthes scabra]
MWPKVEGDPTIPPIFRVKPARRSMVRIREHDENRSQTNYRRTATSVTYSNRGQYGHNRYCPNPIVTDGVGAGAVATGSRAIGHRFANIRAAADLQPPTPLAEATSQPPPPPPTTPPTTQSLPPVVATSHPAPTSSQSPQLASSQPIPATAQPRVRVFSFRRSGRLKLAVRKPQNQPP